MSSPLLTTKLYTPPPHPNLVSRPRLVERLDEGLRLGHRVTVISAPAGFGKTTLVTEWLHGLKTRTAERAIPVTWLSLDEGDNDPVRFLTYLITALQQVDGNIGQATQSLLGGPQLPPVESLVTLLINDVAATATTLVLVLDDYHLIRIPTIHDALAFLLEHQPPHMHVCLVTRKDPPLPLSRLRVRGQMTEIRAEDLRFTAEEAATFLNQALGLALDTEMVATLEARTEGWVAGLQLAALSMQGKEATRIADFVNAFSGSHRHVIDYLADEVLAQQSETTQEFLRQTAVLERLTSPLCDALTGRDDGDAMLKQLEQANLFLVPLDDQREWYRYHRLFADFLRTELEPQQAATAHLKAARWLEGHGLLPEAVEHALASGDIEEASRIITPAAGQALANGELATILGWLDALPDDVVRASPWLASYKAWCLIATGQLQSGESYIQSAADSLPADAPPIDRGRVLSLRCPLLGPEEKVRIAQEALDLIGDEDPLSRSNTLFMLADAQDAIGDVTGAVETFRKAYQLGQQHSLQIIAAAALGHLAISLNEQGKRRQAMDVCRHGADQYVDARGNPLPIAGLIHIVLGEMAYESNDLDQALQYLQTALELGRQSAVMIVVLYAMEELAKIKYAMGQKEEALVTVQESRRIASEADEHGWADAAATLEAHLQLRLGNVPPAESWAEKAGFPTSPLPDLADRYKCPVYVRLLLAQGRPKEARALLAEMERSARADGRYRQLITIHILQALTEQALGNEAQVVANVGQSLRLAAPEGYVRAFLDEGPAVAELLPKVRSTAPTFVGTLLKAFDVTPETAGPPPMIEPLSEREMEVIRLMAADLSSPEIAEALVIAVSTARSHIKHIYEKLDAHSRYEAVERARMLGLV